MVDAVEASGIEVGCSDSSSAVNVCCIKSAIWRVKLVVKQTHTVVKSGSSKLDVVVVYRQGLLILWHARQMGCVSSHLTCLWRHVKLQAKSTIRQCCKCRNLTTWTRQTHHPVLALRPLPFVLRTRLTGRFDCGILVHLVVF